MNADIIENVLAFNNQFPSKPHHSYLSGSRCCKLFQDRPAANDSSQRASRAAESGLYGAPPSCKQAIQHAARRGNAQWPTSLEVIEWES